MAIALDDEDLVSLEIQGGFSLLVTVLFIVAVIFGLWLLEKALRYICKYYKMNNLNSILIKNIFMCNCNTQFRLPCVTVLSLLEMHSGGNIQRPQCRPFSPGVLGASDLILIYYWGRLCSAAPMGGGPCSAVL